MKWKPKKEIRKKPERRENFESNTSGYNLNKINEQIQSGKNTEAIWATLFNTLKVFHMHCKLQHKLAGGVVLIYYLLKIFSVAFYDVRKMIDHMGDMSF